MGWRVLLTPPLGGAENMALDEVLMHHSRDTSECVLRLYSWSQPTLSLGRNQPARGRYDVARARELGVDIVRRPTGGRAVLHNREVTYAVTAPAIALGTLRESYDWINRLLIEGLLGIAVKARVAQPVAKAPRPSPAPCFEMPVAGEIVVGDARNARKLVGSAQFREQNALLQHGSILVENDQRLACDLLVNPASQPSLPEPATLRDLLGRSPAPGEVLAALSAALEKLTGCTPCPFLVDPRLRARTQEVKARYVDDNWTWRL